MAITRSNPPELRGYLGVSNIVAAGGFAFIAGQSGEDAEGNAEVGIEAQLEKLYDNLELACREAGGSLDRMVKTTTFITDVSFMPAVRAARDRRYGGRPPANSTVVVAGLAQSELLVEIEGVLYLGE